MPTTALDLIVYLQNMLDPRGTHLTIFSFLSVDCNNKQIELSRQPYLLTFNHGLCLLASFTCFWLLDICLSCFLHCSYS